MSPSSEFSDTPVERAAARLRERYGFDNLTLAEVAAELRRSVGGLRFALASTRRRHQPWVRRLLSGKKRIGRAVFFDAGVVAAVIVHGDDQSFADEDSPIT